MKIFHIRHVLNVLRKRFPIRTDRFLMCETSSKNHARHPFLCSFCSRPPNTSSIDSSLSSPALSLGRYPKAHEFRQQLWETTPAGQEAPFSLELVQCRHADNRPEAPLLVKTLSRAFAFTHSLKILFCRPSNNTIISICSDKLYLLI